MSSGQRDLPGEFGDYSLGELIGSGGMGDVYHATDRALGRKVAVKLIRASGGPRSNAMWIRFQQEAKAIAQLRSPHTIELYAFGASPSGTLYYAMELLQGCNLQALVEDYGPVHPGRAVSLLMQACTSLEEAHDMDLIHRDIKPANLFTARMGKQVDHLKVLDFGVVKHAAVPTATLTRTGALVGSPAYIAPEALSESGIDHRADIYSLGCVAYWLLGGTSPFARKSVMATLMAHASDMPEPLTECAPQPISQDLSDLVLQCIAKDPEERLQTVSALLEALEQVPEAQTWSSSMSKRWWAEHRPDQAQADQAQAADGALPTSPADVEELSVRPTSSFAAETFLGTMVDGPAEDVHTTDGMGAPGNLEPPTFPLIGRKEELRTLEQWLVQDGARLITLRGFGGAGKTRLALELGDRVRAHYPDGVWFLTLAHLSPSDPLLPRVAALFEVGAEALDVFLANKRLLILIDNCEHVLDQVATLVSRLLQAPGLSLIATTREPLGLRQERHFDLGGLPVPLEDSDHDTLLSNASVQLFMQHAVSTKPAFTLDETAAIQVSRIVRTVAGIPLAIELAASRLRMLSVSEIARRLEQSVSFLRRRDRDSLPHHQTLENAIDWSFKLLEPRQQQLFRRLAVFRGSFTLEAIAALHETTDDLELLETLGELLNKSMVQQSMEGSSEISRYVVLEPLRQFAEKRVGSEELAQARADHAAYFTSYAAQAGQAIRGPEQLTWLKELRANEGNFLAAISHSLSSSSPDPARRISADLFWFWLAERQLKLVDTHLGAALAIPGGEPLPRAYAMITKAFAMCTMNPEHADQALRLVREGRALFQELGFGPGIGQSRIYEGIVLWNRRALEPCADFFAETVPMMQDANFGWGESMCHWFLGSIAVFDRDFDSARTRFTTAVAGFREGGDLFLLTWALLTEGRLALCEGDVPQARALFEESMPIMRQVGDRMGRGTLFWNLAICAQRDGDSAEAERLAEKAHREIRRGMGGQNMSWAVSNAPVETRAFAQLLDVSQRYREALNGRPEDWVSMMFTDADAWCS